MLARASNKKNNEEKEQVFREGMNFIYGERPNLMKLSRQYFETNISEYENMNCDGITFSNSMKGSLTTKLAGVQVEIFNKGSICGSILTEGTLNKVLIYKKQKPSKYISACGGILDEKISSNAIKNGADSIQLCSGIYFHGFKIITDIYKKLYE